MGRLSVSPRPYQLVPMLMALRLDPVRLLIADDVGVGKTIEAGLIAREMLDRGLVSRVGVLCPPHLCDQWSTELREKFNIETALIQPSRMARLERELPRQDRSVFQHYQHVVASIDFVKAAHYRDSFVQNAPDLIIVDEAHAAARPRSDRGRVQQQRHELLQQLAEDPELNLVLVTATPHSGIEESFRSLLGLLKPEFDLPEDRDLPRDRVARHFVQRKRPDLERWLGRDTPFPERDSAEWPYEMTPEYERLYEDVRTYCQEFVSAGGELHQQQRRVRYWAATAILRCLLSSPSAAEAMLQARRERHLAGNDVDRTGADPESFAPQVLDSADEEEPTDYIPTAPLEHAIIDLQEDEVRRLDGFLSRAKKLAGIEVDAKLAAICEVVGGLLGEGFHPIVYCRFIATAEYVAEQLQDLLQQKHRGLRVQAVTGNDGTSEQRSELVETLVGEPVRVLVATDCLSEGINLQEHFDAVVHYDLPWNPNRLEQREGRVDRYGQQRDMVKTVLLYGTNNVIDLTVLEVLIRKARSIRERWGFSVPVPDSDELVQAVIDGVLLRQSETGHQLSLPIESAAVVGYHQRLDDAAAREEESRSRFAQRTIRPDEVQRELEELEPVLGSVLDLRRFVADALQRVWGALEPTSDPDVFEVQPGELGAVFSERVRGLSFPLRVSFAGLLPDDPLPSRRQDVLALGRNHPLVAAIADHVLARSLAESRETPFFARSSAIVTNVVDRRTAVFVLRLRYLLSETRQKPTFAEEIVTAACRVGDGVVEWIEPREAAVEFLASATPARNLSPEERAEHVRWALELLEREDDWQRPLVEERVTMVMDAHERLRQQAGGGRLNVEPHEPPDVLGCFVLVPAPASD